MADSLQRSELSDLVEGQRRLEEHLKDLKEILLGSLGTIGGPVEAREAGAKAFEEYGPNPAADASRSPSSSAAARHSAGGSFAQHHPRSPAGDAAQRMKCQPLAEAVFQSCDETGRGMPADARLPVCEHVCMDSLDNQRIPISEGPFRSEAKRSPAQNPRKGSLQDILRDLSGDRSETIDSVALSWRSNPRRMAHKIVRSQKFDYAMGILIIVNTITLGIEIQLSLDEDNDLIFLAILEYFFLTCFFVEIVLKLVADGVKNFRQAWFILDLALAITGLIGSLLATIPSQAPEEDGSLLLGMVGIVQLLRILRLLRLLQTLRSIEQFTELWKITIGLIRCFKVVMSAMVLVFVTLYFFSCIAVELIYKSTLLQRDPLTAPLVNAHFDSLPNTMLTLIAFANADSIAGIYVPLCQVAPWLSLYFFALWLILTISLLNLVAAVIVENAISSANEDHDLQQRSMRKQLSTLIPLIKGVFTQLDTEAKGTLDLHELNLNDLKLPSELKHIIEGDKLRDLFEQLDVDGSGDIDEKEFVDGVCHLALSSVPMETVQIIQMLKRHDKQLTQVAHQVSQITDYQPMVN